MDPELAPEEMPERHATELPGTKHSDLRERGEGILRAEGARIGGEPRAEAFELIRGSPVRSSGSTSVRTCAPSRMLRASWAYK